MSGRLHDGAIALLALAVLAGSLLLEPQPASRDLAPSGGACWMAKATGWRCPGCGLTRSCVAFGHGRVRESLAFHPAGSLHVLGSIAAIVSVAVFAIRGSRPLWERRSFRVAVLGLASATIVLGVLRGAWPS